MIDEAIDILYREKTGDNDYITKDMLFKAIQLGIEALERLKEVRESEVKPSLVLWATAKLPSETEEKLNANRQQNQ